KVTALAAGVVAGPGRELQALSRASMHRRHNQVGLASREWGTEGQHRLRCIMGDRHRPVAPGAARS
ncbi:MAG: hypothetical protein WA089_00865, partial [Anaerolineae bacterium]